MNATILEAERHHVRHPAGSVSDDAGSSKARKYDELSIAEELREMAGALDRKQGAAVRGLAMSLELMHRSRIQLHESELSAHMDLTAMGQSAAFLIRLVSDRRRKGAKIEICLLLKKIADHVTVR